MRRSVFPSSKVLIYVIWYVLIARFGAWSKLLKLSSCAFPIRQLSLFWGLLMFMLPIVPGSNGCDMLKDTRWPCLDTSNLQKRLHRWWLRFHPKCIGVDMSWPEVTIEFFEIFWSIWLKSFEACFSFFYSSWMVQHGATICNRFRNSSLFVQWSGPWILQHFQRTSFWSSLARRFSQTWTTDDHGSYHGTRCLADLGQVGIAVGAVLASVLKHVACTGHKAVSLMAVSPSDILWQGIITMMYTVINHN